MKTERLIIIILFLGLIQLAACERSKMNDPEPNSQRANGDSLGNPGDSLGIPFDSLENSIDSLGNYPGDSIPYFPVDSIPLDSVFIPDTLTGGIDSLPYVDSVNLQRKAKAIFTKK